VAHRKDQENNAKKGNEAHNSGKVNHYRVTLQAEADQQVVSAALTKLIVETGQDLYTLQPEHRNLETLFRKVSEEHYQKGDTDVAA
jgi:hypothetical protein